MNNFYKLAFTNNKGITHFEHYADKYPKDWFRIDVDYVRVPFICTGEDTLATCDIADYVKRIICECEDGAVCSFVDTIHPELSRLKKLGDFVEFYINGGLFSAEVVEPPTIDIKKTIEENSLKPYQMRFVYVNDKCLLEEGKRYNGLWYTWAPFEKARDTLAGLVKRLYPDILEIDFTDGEDFEVEIVAKTPKAIEDVLKEVFSCDIGDGIHDYVRYGNGDTIERVKYTAIFTNF